MAGTQAVDTGFIPRHRIVYHYAKMFCWVYIGRRTIPIDTCGGRDLPGGALMVI